MLIENIIISLTDVTIAYNNKEGLKRTIDSFLEQDLTESNLRLQVIVIDGGSRDGSKELLEDYSLIAKKRGLNFLYISEPDKGIYDAMNKGISRASGDWIIFMNSGDTLYSKNTLSVFWGYAIENGLLDKDILYGESLRVYSNKNEIWEPNDLSMITKGLPFSHQSVFTKTKLFKERLYDTSFKISGDYEWFLGEYMNKKTFAYIPVCVSSFDTKGISSQMLYGNYLEVERIRDRYNISDSKVMRVVKRVVWLFLDKLKMGSRVIEKMNQIFAKLHF